VSLELTDRQLDALADRLAPRLAALLADAKPAPGERQLVTAAALARELGTTRTWVYEHAEELGVVRLGEQGKDAKGKDRRPRLRFDLEAARAQTACSAGKPSHAEKPSVDGAPARKMKRRPARLPNRLPTKGAIRARPRVIVT